MNQVRAIDIRLLGKKRTGDETVFFNLTKEILAADKEHKYLLLTDEADPRKIAIIQGRLQCVGQQNVRFVTLFGKNRFSWNLFGLPWFLLHHHVDTLHTQYILPLLVPKRTRVLLHIHDVSFRAYPELIAWKDRFFLSLLIPRSLKRADCILTPSQFTKDEIVRYYGTAAEKIAVIPNAISGDFLNTELGDAPLVREKYHLPETYVLYVGTLQPRKNIPFLIRAFAQVRKRVPELSLVLVGNLRAHHVDTDIEATVAELGLTEAVSFPGYIDEHDLPAVMRQATVFVFPSLYEGFGIPLLEAMSQGVSVLSSDTPALKEVAADAVVYFETGSVASCAEKLYTLLTDENQRENGILRGRNRVSLFSWSKSVLALLRVYETLGK